MIVSAFLSASAAALDWKSHFPEVVTPGSILTVQGSFDKSKTTTLTLHSLTNGNPQPPLTGKISDDASTFSATLPDGTPPGRYYATLDNGGDLKDQQITGELRVQVDAVKLDATHPTTAYRNAETGLFDFEVVGQNFSPDADNDHIYIAGQGDVIKSRAADATKCADPANRKPCLWVEAPEKLHVVGYEAEPYQGPLRLSVGVGVIRSGERQLVLSRMSAARVVASTILIFGVLGFIIYRLVARGLKDDVIDGKHYSAFWSFFIDPQSNSYSLSKFQLLLFSCTFVFGYLYVFLCRWLVQWQFMLPDVPSNFSAILGMSAGTTVIAAGATAARGSKGSGARYPSAADFISIGGQVVPERFQFFVWTLVACFGFIALLVSQDPATISGFPNIPYGLLYVMGVSATGYLGGKVVRKPGPVIRNIAWAKNTDPNTPNTVGTITIQGENLSADGDFGIDGKKLPIDPAAAGPLVKLTPQDEAADKTFCSKLEIKVNLAAGVDLSSGDHDFRIANPDGQFAESRFTADPVTIMTVAVDGGAVKSGVSALQLTVTGSGFREGSTARWTPPGAQEAVDLPPASVQFSDSKTIKVTLVPGGKGTGTLLLMTPSGFAVTKTVTVV